MVTSNFRQEHQEVNDLSEVESKADFRDNPLYATEVSSL